MSEAAPSTQIELQRWKEGAWRTAADELAAEEPLEIRVEGQSIAVTMRTPGHDRELAAGFLFTEGIVQSPSEIFDITTCVPSGAGKGNAVDVGLTRPAAFDPTRFSRHIVTSASCGLCGKNSIEEVLRRHPPLPETLRVSPQLILSLPAKLDGHQDTFRRTGGLHACALFSAQGEFQQAREDIGRHNALDKLIGWAFREKRLPLSESILLLSGRASFEMIQKAQSAGVQIVAAISAPSSLAVELAREGHQTLIGFLRSETMNLYTAPARVLIGKGE